MYMGAGMSVRCRFPNVSKLVLRVFFLTVQELLETISFDRGAGDHLIFTGNMIAKGPDSRGVVDLARRLHASCVRGNDDDRVLLFRRQQQQHSKSHGTESPVELPEIAITSEDKALLQLAQELSDEQASWLEGCPAILRVGAIKGMGEVVVAHAGLVPGVDLEHQDPVSVMTMRSIDVETHVPSAKEEGIAWTKVSIFLQKNKSRYPELS